MTKQIKCLVYTCKPSTNVVWELNDSYPQPTIYFTTSYEEAVESLSYVYGEYIYEVEVTLYLDQKVEFEYSSGYGDTSAPGQWGLRRSPSWVAYDKALWIHCNKGSFVKEPRLVADAICLGRWAAA